MNTSDSPSFGLLVTRDLFFGSKVTSTANELGLRVELVDSAEKALDRVSTGQCRLVIVDLALPGIALANLMSQLPHEDRPKVIAFGAHVLTAALDEARAAGCDDVMPRSKFSATLPALLQHYLDDTP